MDGFVISNDNYTDNVPTVVRSGPMLIPNRKLNLLSRHVSQGQESSCPGMQSCVYMNDALLLGFSPEISSIFIEIPVSPNGMRIVLYCVQVIY